MDVPPQRMAPAPLLPSVFQDAPGALSGEENRGARADCDPAPAPSEAAGPLSRMAALTRQIAESHLAHIAGIVALERQFLALREATSLPALLGRSLPQLPVGLPQPTATPGHRARSGEPAPERQPQLAWEPQSARESQPSVPPRPLYTRADLEGLSGGKVHSLLGPRFAHVARYPHQIRLPRPPMLLADRVTSIEGELGAMGPGTIRGETDLREDTGFVDDCGRMFASLFFEGVQFNLLLAAYLGGDLQHPGNRLFRLAEFHATLHGPLPKMGETVVYDFTVENTASLGDTTLFFATARYSVGGVLRASSRRTVSGLFPAGDSPSAPGVSWDAATDDRQLEGAVDPPELACQGGAFSSEAVRAFAAGDAYACFGPAFKRAATQVRSPRIPSGRFLMLDQVSALDPKGGPWGRGYLRAELPVAKDAWFFAAHFPDDPCMPGCLMFEGCYQAMAFYLAALGYTASRDGFRFEPVPQRDYVFKFRSPILPSDRRVSFEVFVESVSAGPLPTLIADLVCSVDGRQAFHARRFGLQLVPDWPLETWRRLPYREPGEFGPLAALGGLAGYVAPKAAARLADREFGYPRLLANSWGLLAEAFLPSHARCDGPARRPRLPGPPFLFITRVTKIVGAEGKLQAGGSVETEYETPAAHCWYFAPGGEAVMPFPILLEALLQPCGWLSCFLWGAGHADDGDAYYRNLDGSGTVVGEVRPSEVLRVRATLTSVSQMQETTLLGFRVESFVGERRIYALETMFGQFPKAALQTQAGIPTTPEQQQRIHESADFLVDLQPRPPRYFRSAPALPDSPLLMLDRVTNYLARGGRAGLGYARAETAVDPRAWFFKSHFFRDPVQPGSLGIEALCQLLQFHMIEGGLGRDVPGARFEALMHERPLRWKYRGQVLPESQLVTTEIEVTQVGADERGPYAIADGWLWVDGVCVYSLIGLAMRIVPGRGEQSVVNPGTSLAAPAPASTATERLFDPGVDRWVADHCPSWTVPTVPILSMAEWMAEEAESRTGRKVTGISELQVRRWLIVTEPVRLRIELAAEAGDSLRATLLVWRAARTAELSRFEPVAVASVRFDAPGEAVEPLPPVDGEVLADPYLNATVFHGPAFQVVTSGRMGPRGSSGMIRVDRCQVPGKLLHPGLLDAVFHLIRSDEAWRTWPGVAREHGALPTRIELLRIHRRLDPALQELRIEARPELPAPDQPTLYMQLIGAGRVIAELRVALVLLPSPFGQASAVDKRAFIRDKRYVPGLSLAQVEGSATVLLAQTLQRFDWLRGSVAATYDVPPARQADLLAEVAIREHVARRAACHPSQVAVSLADSAGRVWATVAHEAQRRYPVQLTRSATGVRVDDWIEPQST